MIGTASTKLYGIVGSPICHSKSPKMHNLAFDKLGIDAVFLAFEGDEANVKDIFDSFRALNVQGGSITMPVKKAAIACLDGLSKEASLIGTVNVFKNEDGKFIGYNTDGMGLVMMLDDNHFPYKNEKVFVAGVGGAGRSVAVQLALSGVRELVICDSYKEGVEDIAAVIKNSINTCDVSICDANEEAIKAELSNGTSIYVDCTPLGMTPNENESMINNFDGISKDMIFVDITYAPLETKLLRLAREHGCRTCNGVGMMFNQGAKAFKIWTGADMPLEYVKENS